MAKNTKKKKRRLLPAQQRRREILKAAAQVFSEKGYTKARISDIAARANMGHGTVYRFFASKRELAIQVIGARGATGFLQAMREQSLNNFDPKGLLKAIGKNYLGNMAERLPIVRFSIAEALSDQNLARRYYANLLLPLFDGLAEVMAGFQKKGFLKQNDSFLQAHIFYSMLFGYMYAQELLCGKDTSHMTKEALIAQVVDVFLHGVLQKES